MRYYILLLGIALTGCGGGASSFDQSCQDMAGATDTLTRSEVRVFCGCLNNRTNAIPSEERRLLGALMRDAANGLDLDQKAADALRSGELSPAMARQFFAGLQSCSMEAVS